MKNKITIILIIIAILSIAGISSYTIWKNSEDNIAKVQKMRMFQQLKK